MNDILSGGRSVTLLPLVCFLLLAAVLPAFSSESCSMMGGKCRSACFANESAEAGVFEDCAANQECCVARSESKVRCCILSMDASMFGPANCTAPKNNACPAGSAVPVPCEGLRMCATAK